VPAGESFGLLGPYGAGKSTTMKMIGAVAQRTSGKHGLDPDSHGPEVRRSWAWCRSRTTWTRSSTGFTAVMGLMGLLTTHWAILMIPASLHIAFGFASLGMGITSFLKTFQQMDWINFIMLPMFLVSATFYPLSIYPQYIQWLLQAMPLWHGVELLRQLSVGVFTPATAIHVGYYLLMIALGMLVTTVRLRKLFLK
jgi:ABC-type polysaccharide/polyol phosphate export permease